VQRISDFLKDVDRRWAPISDQKIRLRIIGSAALMLQTGYERGTKDSDVLETDWITQDIKAQLLQLGGPDSELYERHRIYIDVVSRGIPFLPQVPLCHLQADLNRELTRFEVEVLDLVDVVVSKLKRFNSNDQSDIRAMADMGLIDHPRLVERFRAAVDIFSHDARADDLPEYIRNLNRIERDDLLVPESKIELPEWIG
jgi:hypothetical protein